MNPIYADYNATTPVSSSVRKAMDEAFDLWGNPSSSHQAGRVARAALENAREKVAHAVGAKPTEVVFTSGGSEANGLALMGSFFSSTDFRVLTTSIEHSSVRDTLNFMEKKGAHIQRLAISSEGELDLSKLSQALKEFRPHLVSIMAANNETGSTYPTPEISALCKEHGALFHTDAVQALGKIDKVLWNQADLISVSAHKIQGPKGAGALVIRNAVQLVPTHFGGSQEIKRRGGTEALPNLVGFGKACETLDASQYAEQLTPLRDHFEARLKAGVPDVVVLGAGLPRLANTSNLRIPGIASEILLSSLDLDGVYLSAGSACSSGSIEPSHVLLEQGLTTEQAKEHLRFSWGRATSQADIDRVVELMLHHVQRIRSRPRWQR